MRNLFQIIASLLLLLNVGQLSAQESNYVRQPGYWTLGLNAGLAYQSSDICSTLDGWGVGATLAKNLYYQPGAPLTFDLRGRLLYDQSYGLDHFPSYGIENNPGLSDYQVKNGGDGFVYLNNQTHHGELGVEGVIGLNRLREKTNINLSLFGGIGLDYYATYTDQKNEFGDIYDYTTDNIDLNSNRQTVNSQLERQLDGRFETEAEGFGEAGQVAFMPAVGLELGYQLTPRFGIGLGHKLTFTKTDLFDGQQWDTNNRLTGNNDLHHYTNLHFRWIIESEKHKIKAPVIELVTPATNPYSTSNPLALIKARIKNINSLMDVEYIVNGRSVGSDFRKGILSNDFYLQPGRNEVFISATNSVGHDQEKVIIYYNEPEVVHPHTTTNTRKPHVNFTNPSRSTTYTSSDYYTVTASIKNVNNRNEINFEINGNRITNFSFDSRKNSFTSDIRLTPGENRLRIIATNQTGQDSDQTTIYYDNKQPTHAPHVKITKVSSPSPDPSHPGQCKISIKAEVLHVKNKNDIIYLLDGKRVYDFSYNTTTDELTSNISIKKGKHTVVIKANNKTGSDQDEAKVNGCISTTTTGKAPEINITSPHNNLNTESSTVAIKAVLKRVNRKSDITFTVNGKRITSFNFKTDQGIFSATITLQEGNNSIVITGQNRYGKDSDNINIRFKKAIAPPTVRITSPRSRTTTDKSSATLKASTSGVNHQKDITLKVNGKTISKFSFSKGTLTAKVNLKSGSNIIFVEARNKAGKANDQVIVVYQKAIAPPTVRITSPRSRTSTDKNSATLKASISEVNHQKDIILKVNGKTISKFSFSKGTLTAKVNLKSGSNIIFVEARNKAGKANDQVIVVYQKAIAPPTVRITSPRSRKSTDKSSATLKASISGVNHQKDITLKVNGKTISKFSFNKGTLTAKVNLKTGSNIIFVEAQNKAGKANDQVNVVHRKTNVSDNPPSISAFSISQPTIDPFNPDSARSGVDATLSNITSKEQIKLYMNNVPIDDFTFSSSTKKLTAIITLTRGNNTVKIVATNSGGTIEETKTMVF